MIDLPAGLVKRIFPERQLLVRSGETVRYLLLPGWMQIGGLLGALVLVVGVGGLVGAYHNLHKAVHRKEAEISAAANRAIALADLRGALARTDAQYLQMSQQLEDAKRQIEDAATANEALRAEIGAAEARDAALDKTRIALEARLHGAEQALASKTGNLKELTKQLSESETALKNAVEARAELQKKMAALQADSQTAYGRSDVLKRSLADREQQLSQIAVERDRLRAQLEQQAAHAAPASYASRLEQLIASTGIDLDRMLARYRAPEGQGGPFINLDPKTLALQDKTREEALKNLIKVLPLAAPLDQYTLESPFGPRIDPLNHRSAFHTGVDLSAPYRTPVYSTAAGVVTFTGVKNEYGHVVEITHADGIVTRYAHLHRSLVAPGQRVRAHQPIGELGSTGRSTGPHVHYEVLVDGVPLDPAKFMEAGKGVIAISGR